MKRVIIFLLVIFSFGFVSLVAQIPGGSSKKITLNLTEQDWELDKGITTRIYSYNNTMPGMVIRANVGDILKIDGVNKLPVTTSVHWHGLIVPVEQDGPDRAIAPGQPYSYHFQLKNSGTYWYHSHTRPVATQVDMGLFAPFIVESAEDKLYDKDAIVVFDDLFIDSKGNRVEGVGVGHLERLGNVLAINGKIRSSVAPLRFKKGDVNKIRLLNTSTAAFLKILFPLPVRLTHEDGAGLSIPIDGSKEILLSPAQRVDVEFIGQQAGNFGISVSLTDRREKGKDYGVSTELPLIVTESSQKIKGYVYVPKEKESVQHLLTENPDYTFILDSRMKENMNHGESVMNMGNQGGHSMHGETMSTESPKIQDGNSMADMMEWTINGQIFPNVPPVDIKVGQWVKIRFINKDSHPMDHPMHIHGAHFRVLSINGETAGLSEVGLERDVFDIPHGGYVDIAFKAQNPGNWMLHCHILDHEDGGMMMVVRATE